MATRKPSKKKPAAAKKPTARKPAPRKSPMAGMSVAAWTKTQTAGWQTDTVRALVKLVAGVVPGSSVAIKWGRPVFEANGPLAWVMPARAHVTLGFWRGAQLEDADGVLEGSGALMRHLKLEAPGTFNRRQLTSLIEQAAALNATKGSPTRG